MIRILSDISMPPTLAQVDAYPVPELLIPRIMESHKRDRAFAEAIVFEAKRMLWLTQVVGHPMCPSVEIDDAWHEMILFTPDYFAFCKFLGTDYIHHSPRSETPSSPDGNPNKSLYDVTLEAYRKHIGAPDQRYWTP